ncbi:MAG: heme-binding protein [Rhodospirillales bacterium]|nr:heme-binding protein [Rhodospirillales bacterium]
MSRSATPSRIAGDIPRRLRSVGFGGIVRMAAGSLAGALASPAAAQVQAHDRTLPLDLAVEAAREAVRVCATHDWPVSAAVVDAEGVVRVQLKGDRSTIHTRDSSFRKAYTQITLGPVFGFDRLSEGVAAFRANPNGPALASLPDVLLLAGAVAVKVDGEPIAAIGVGGAPGGDKDEAWAAAGLAKIADQLTSVPRARP